MGCKQLGDSGLAHPRKDAETLLMGVTDLERADLIAHPERLLTEDERIRYQAVLARRRQSEPIQYITGHREFYGLTFKVTPEVLIPRPETEHLVEAALARIPLDRPFQIADIGTGSGAIAIALAVNRPFARVVALDISPSALDVSKKNAADHKVADRVRLLKSDLLDAVGDEQFDMIVSNPPYIADADREALAAEVRDYEPATALFAGPTGLEVYERLIPQAAEHLRENGWLLLEIGAGQQLQLRQFLNGWTEVGFVDDLQGIPRVAIARRA